ncbi:MAG TPA: SGNH/GDSL hydrolase family protein [Casimicrobiaceae bacterium]|nr:SGNH/GDSL hydrolase family protein [Casimicrobiaceae bacterium]
MADIRPAAPAHGSPTRLGDIGNAPAGHAQGDRETEPLTPGKLARKLAGRLVIFALFPVVFMQAFALRRHALQFDPAVGPREGRIGRGEPLHFLAIGDSIIAGVGARHVRRSTVGHVTRFMSGRLSREINWRAVGMIGAGARRVRRDVVPALPSQRYDAILLSVGVNDVLKLERSGRFRRQLLKLLHELRVHSPDAVIAYLGLPPLDEFPKLRRPLRWIVGYRVRRFDAAAREALARVPDVMHVPVRIAPRADLFSNDGLHPSETGQRRLAKVIAGALTPVLAKRGLAGQRPGG